MSSSVLSLRRRTRGQKRQREPPVGPEAGHRPSLCRGSRQHRLLFLRVSPTRCLALTLTLTCCDCLPGGCFFFFSPLHRPWGLGGACSPLIGQRGTDCTLPCPRHVVGLLGWMRCSRVGSRLPGEPYITCRYGRHRTPPPIPTPRGILLCHFCEVLIRLGRELVPI